MRPYCGVGMNSGVKTMQPSVELCVLLYQQGDFWIAQCIDYDIAAQGTSITKAVEAFQWTFYSHLLLDQRKGRKPLTTVPAAPIQFRRLFDSAIPLGVKSALPEVTEDRSSIREEFRIAA